MKTIIVYTTIYRQDLLEVEDDVYEDRDKRKEKVKEFSEKLAGDNDFDYE